ncbi:CDGP domain-containing protein [Mycobacteroides abscessus]|uniref:CDGP domain-containing protein n=1 Tax=Mycobacteroides abscessus TaxID=36809 RepID=UPI0009A5F8E3|nr:hypothetical protein [Mycobacteroides abscessus]MDM3950383.1 hypothetical protein [Mycobacteroides abscessus]SLI92910.1 Uncharacterised protein [Mycobacteroides abscessus subsp. massiliense]
MGKIAALAAATAAIAATIFGTAPAQADPLPPGCEQVPIFGLNPQVRKICDGPIQQGPNGPWWSRSRQFWSPQYRRSSCGGTNYQGGCSRDRQDERDVTPASEGDIERYIVTPETIPPGEPGHLN